LDGKIVKISFNANPGIGDVMGTIRLSGLSRFSLFPVLIFHQFFACDTIGAHHIGHTPHCFFMPRKAPISDAIFDYCDGQPMSNRVQGGGVDGNVRQRSADEDVRDKLGPKGLN
jgi:hypothetical protein